MQTSNLLQKKLKRKKTDDIVICIEKTNIYLNQLNNTHNYFRQVNPIKSEIIEKMEKSGINYGKCLFNNSNIKYKIEKIKLNIPIIPKICSKPILFVNLIYYNNKCYFFIGHSFNLLVFEIKGNDSLFISSIFEINPNDSFLEDKIDKIYLLNENDLSNKIQFVIIGKIVSIYEFNFLEGGFMNKKNIFFDDFFSNNIKYKLIKYTTKLIIYDEKNMEIYDLIDSKNTNLEITLGDSDDNIKIIQNFPNNLIFIITDKFLIIFDIISESIIHKISKKLQFGLEKILLLNNTQFLLYSDSTVTIYNYDLNKKMSLPQVDKKLNLSNIKNINKILQIKNNDLIIFYESFNFAVFDMKYNFIKYKKLGKELNYICNNLFPKEIQPNILAYKTDLYNINFIDIIKGEILGTFGINKNNILTFKKIKEYYITEETNKNNNKIYYFILAGKSCYILSN